MVDLEHGVAGLEPALLAALDLREVKAEETDSQHRYQEDTRWVFLAFSLLVVAVGTDSPPSDVRAAVLVGWLKAGLAAETMEAQRPEPPRRKQTIGFKIRSPITRETEGREGPENSQRTTPGSP